MLGGGVDHDHQIIGDAAGREGRVLATSRHLRGPCEPAIDLCEVEIASQRPEHIALGHALGARVLQEQLEEAPHVRIIDPLCSLRPQAVMPEVGEGGLQVNVEDAGLLGHERFRYPCNGSMGAPLGAVALRPCLEVRFDDRLQDELERPWHHTVPDGRDRQDPHACAVALRHRLTPVPRGSIRAVDQFVASLVEEAFHPCGLNGLARLPVTPGGAVMFFGQVGGRSQGLPLADVDEQAPETPGRCSLRLGVYPPAQGLQTDRRFSQGASASRVVRGVTHTRVPLLHRPYPVSSRLRTPPPPSRLRPISRGYRVYDLPCSADFAAGRGGLLQLRDPSLSPGCPCHPVGGTDRLSQGTIRPAAFVPSVAGSASKVAHLRGHVCVRLRYDPVTRCHPADGVVDGLQRLGFPPPCHPSSKVLAFPLAGLTPAERVRLRWTHNGAGVLQRTPLSSMVV